MNGPNFDPRLALDLRKLQGDQVADLSQAAYDERKEEAEKDEAERWTKAMRRTFRGIFPHAVRVRNLARYAKENT